MQIKRCICVINCYFFKSIILSPGFVGDSQKPKSIGFDDKISSNLSKSKKSLQNEL